MPDTSPSRAAKPLGPQAWLGQVLLYGLFALAIGVFSQWPSYRHLGGDQAGLTVRPGSPEALAEGLLTLLSDPGRRQAMGDRGQEMAERYYWDVQVHQFARVYEL